MRVPGEGGCLPRGGGGGSFWELRGDSQSVGLLEGTWSLGSDGGGVSPVSLGYFLGLRWRGGGPSFGWLSGGVPVLGLRVWGGVLCVGWLARGVPVLDLEGGAAAPALVCLLEGSRALGSEFRTASSLSVGVPKWSKSSG